MIYFDLTDYLLLFFFSWFSSRVDTQHLVLYQISQLAVRHFYFSLVELHEKYPSVKLMLAQLLSLKVGQNKKWDSKKCCTFSTV